MFADRVMGDYEDIAYEDFELSEEDAALIGEEAMTEEEWSARQEGRFEDEDIETFDTAAEQLDNARIEKENPELFKGLEDALGGKTDSFSPVLNELEAEELPEEVFPDETEQTQEEKKQADLTEEEIEEAEEEKAKRQQLPLIPDRYDDGIEPEERQEAHKLGWTENDTPEAIVAKYLLGAELRKQAVHLQTKSGIHVEACPEEQDNLQKKMERLLDPNAFDDKIKGVNVYINGRQVTFDELVEFVKQNKKEFIDACNKEFNQEELDAIHKNREKLYQLLEGYQERRDAERQNLEEKIEGVVGDLELDDEKKQEVKDKIVEAAKTTVKEQTKELESQRRSLDEQLKKARRRRPQNREGRQNGRQQAGRRNQGEER